MKTYWSAFLLSTLLLLTACGQEQFGTPARSEANPVVVNQKLEQRSCANLTLINPEVDILYVVDNSSSTEVIRAGMKEAIKNTLTSVSADFDYRIIGTPLLSTDNNDFQVLAKQPASLPATFSGKKVSSYSEFSFFSQEKVVSGSSEPGLERVRSFISSHSTDGLFRQNAYVFIILVSNGRDTDVEKGQAWNPQETYLAPSSTGGTIYEDRLASIKQLKLALGAKQFRLFSVSASGSGSTCPSGYLTSNKSYVQMSKDLYNNHSPSLMDQSSTTPDHYNLCGNEVSSVFSSVNATIKKIVIPHKYQFWPITFTASTGIDLSKVKVFKSSPTTSQVQLSENVHWKYKQNPGTTDTRIEPTKGEPTTVPHLVEFLPGHEIIYPECVTVTSESNLEFFKSIVLTKPAITNDPQNPIIVRINGVAIPQSAYAYRGQVYEENIKVKHTFNGVTYEATPEQKRSGYFITISDPAYYYKSGDIVEVGFKPAPI